VSITGVSPVVVAADRVVAPDGVLEPGWVRVEGDRIAEVRAGVPPVADQAEHHAEQRAVHTLVPGYVDVHHHGGGVASYTDGPEAARKAIAAHRRHGTTSSIASLVSEDHPTLLRQVLDLAPLVATGEVQGIHLEGPWLSDRHRGAHDPRTLTSPTWPLVEELLAAAGGAIRMVTLAPELPGALDTIARLHAAGVVAAVGHTDATYDQTRAALDAGASAGTHLFNAMRPLHHREPGPVTALLLDPMAYVELIADGVHLHPAVLEQAATAKPDRTVLVTDAMAAAAATDGRYRLGSLSVDVLDGVARLVGDGAIAGSTLTMDRAVQYSVYEAGLPVELALRAATANPAAMLGLDDVGVLRPGARAALLDQDADLGLQRVMKSGAWEAAHATA
jgi:N-acetylglucosamine-6-phosphate deacetylase